MNVILIIIILLLTVFLPITKISFNAISVFLTRLDEYQTEIIGENPLKNIFSL